jgi:hypothetical protein
MASERIDTDGDKQVIRGGGLMGNGDSGPPTLVDVKDGRATVDKSKWGD